MSDNPYAPPLSNIDMGNNHKGGPVKAILVGLLISFLGSIVGAIVVGFAFSIYWTLKGLTPEEITSISQTNTLILIVYLIEGGLFSIWSGYYVAKKTNYKEYKYCTIMVLVGTLLGAIIMLLIPESTKEQPLWYTVTSFIYYPVVVAFGCWLYVNSKKT